jgi:hypothetical protein
VIPRSSLTLVAGVTLVVTLATGCAGHHTGVTPAALNGTPTAAPVSSAAPVSPAAPIGSTAAASASAAAPTSAATTAPANGSAATAAPAAPATATPARQAAAAGNASTLAAITKDLAGIDTGSSAADKDLSAGDSARAQNDNG